MSFPTLSKGREIAVGAIAVAASALFVAAALAPISDPSEQGTARVGEIGARAAERVLAEWEILRRRPDLGVLAASDSVRISADRASRTESASPRDVARDRTKAPSVVDVLLSVSERAELQGNASEALAPALQALERAEDDHERARAGVRVVQIAAQSGDDVALREAWSQLARTLTGAEALEGTSCFLVAGLAALPRLDAASRASACALLRERWSSGALALPGRDPHFERVGERRTLSIDPSRAALRARLESACAAPVASHAAGAPSSLATVGSSTSSSQSMAPSASSAPDSLHSSSTSDVAVTTSTAPSQSGLDAASTSSARGSSSVLDTTDDAAFALARLLPSDLRAERDAWTFVASGEDVLACRAREDGLDVAFVRPAAIASELEAALERGGALESGLRLDVGGARDDLGALVREPFALPASPLVAALRHPDLEALASEGASRARWQRGGLLALAVATLAAGGATVLALRRDRRLHALRARFVADVSHELRTPIASILLMAENLRANRVPDPARYHALIEREAQRLRRLADDVLDVSRLERGRKLDARREDVDLRRWADELRGDLEHQASTRSGICAVSIGALPERGSLDPEALRRAVQNLVDNALKHSGTNAVEVELRVMRGVAHAAEIELRVGRGPALAMRTANEDRLVEQPGSSRADARANASASPSAASAAFSTADAARDDVMRIAVRDRGKGLNARQRTSAFEPFARFVSGTDSIAGAGLGLAIVRAIAEAHGGAAFARAPDEGPGIVFEIEIPLSETHAA